MEINEVIKYVSPIAALGIIWSIVQFYQKNKIDKKNRERNEKIESFKKIHLALNHLKQVLNSYNTEFLQVSQMVRKLKYDFYAKKIETIEKIDKSNSNVDIAQNYRLINQEEKNIQVLVEKEIEKSKEILERLKNALKSEMKVVDKISIIELKSFPIFHLKISALVSSINDLIILISTGNAVEENGSVNLEFVDHFSEIATHISELEGLMFNELR